MPVAMDQKFGGSLRPFGGRGWEGVQNSGTSERTEIPAG